MKKLNQKPNIMNSPRRAAASRTQRRRRQSLLFMAPAFAFVFVFLFYPIVYSAYMSLNDYNFARDANASFTGADNYVKAFNDPIFLQSLRNTLVYSASYFVLVMVISLALALALFSIKRLSEFFRTSIFLAVVVPLSLGALVFQWILQDNFGLLNHLLREVLGLPDLARDWLGNGSTAMASIVGVGLWSTIGFVTILFLGGLQSLPEDMLEAAKIDGATGWRRILYVILPNLRETYVITGIWAAIQGLKVFVEPMVMTGGGPANSTLVMYQKIYSTAFSRYDMGYASAMAYILATITLVFALINFYVNRSRT